MASVLFFGSGFESRLLGFSSAFLDLNGAGHNFKKLQSRLGVANPSCQLIFTFEVE
jgi:hypothetical protein